MRVSTWIVSFAVVAALSPLAAFAQSRTVELQCVNKSGENMYRAADGSVVLTDSCGQEPRCADASVTIGSTPNSGVIRWYGGGSCHVVNAAFSRSAARGDGAAGGARARKQRTRPRS
jgi:hypothetical protein